MSYCLKIAQGPGLLITWNWPGYLYLMTFDAEIATPLKTTIGPDIASKIKGRFVKSCILHLWHQFSVYNSTYQSPSAIKGY